MKNTDYPEQLTLADMHRSEPRPEPTPRELRDAAIDRALDHAGIPWKFRAEEVIWYCAKKYPYFTSDDYHRLAEDMKLPKPPDARAWGGILVLARKNGWISKTGEYRESTRRVCHVAPKPVYQSHVYRPKG